MSVKDSQRVHIQLEKDIHDKLELLFYDPARQQVRYGKRSRLINQLLRKWIAELPKSPGTVRDIIDGIGD